MSKLLCQSKMFFKRNGATILTCVGGVGVVATSVLAVKATPKAIELLKEAEEVKGEELTKTEKVKIAGPVYIPAIATGAATIGCIFGANVLNKRQQASLVSAYALLDKSYKEYKDKVKELYGEDANTHVVEKIVKDKSVDADPPEDDKRLFFDQFSGRYYNATMADVIRAEYLLNREINTRGGATLNDYYAFLGIPPIDAGNCVGWSEGSNWERYWQSWVDFNHHETTIDDDLECCIVFMLQEPTPGFDNY